MIGPLVRVGRSSKLMAEEMMAGYTLKSGPEESGREDTYFLPQGALPPGMKVNAGDVLEFKVVGQDKDGNIEVEYNHGDNSKSSDEEGGMSWQDEMRQNVGNEGAPMQSY